MKAGLSGLGEAFGRGVCPHVPLFVSKEGPCGGSLGSWAGPRLGMMKPRCFHPVGQLLQGLVPTRGSTPLVRLLGSVGVNVNREQVEVGSRKGVSEPNGWK